MQVIYHMCRFHEAQSQPVAQPSQTSHQPLVHLYSRRDVSSTTHSLEERRIKGRKCRKSFRVSVTTNCGCEGNNTKLKSNAILGGVSSVSRLAMIACAMYARRLPVLPEYALSCFLSPASVMKNESK